MVKPGDVISYLEMCSEEGVNLQRGMNFHLRGKYSVILMSVRAGAPYSDRVEDGGKVLVYEGHDISQTLNETRRNGEKLLVEKLSKLYWNNDTQIIGDK